MVYLIIVFFLGFGFGMLVKHIFEKHEDEKLTEYSYEGEHSYWRIVRYHYNGEFDCVWENNIYGKRKADKMCAKFNNPNEGPEWEYGKYVVEKED